MKLRYITILFLLFTSLHYSQIDWFKYPGNPVLVPGPDSWDIGSVGFGKVVFDGSEYKMWYMGGTAATQNLQIGYATSLDGMSWTKYSGNPVLTPGDPGTWESGGVGTPTVIRDGDTLKMWYAASTTNPPSQIQIGYATSVDGIIWIKHPDNPVLELGSPGEWDDYWLTLPTVVKDGSTYKMWYTGSQFPEGTERIGLASSPDGINWIKHNDPSTPNAPYAESDPVLSVTPGSWDTYLVYQPCVIRNALFMGYYFEMWYTGNTSTGIQKIGYATSTDGTVGIEWNKHPDPVLAETFDLLAPSIVYLDAIYRMWYTGSDRRIYFAASDSSLFPTSVDDFYITPETFYLSQNYPNPFNPSTVIGYQLPVGSDITLKIYDLLGREVATLVDEFRPAGSYEVEFSASDLTSGIYFYKLQADNYIETRKMILLK